MSEPVRVVDLLARMDEAWPRFRRMASLIGLRALGRPTPAGWTYKEMLAHVAAWHDLTARRFATYRETGRTDPRADRAARETYGALGFSAPAKERLLAAWDPDAFNAAVREAASGRPPAMVLADLASSFGRLRDAVAALDDAQAAAHVSEGRSFVDVVLAANAHGHYDEHREELRSGLPRTAADLVARIEAEWAAFREAVRHVGRARMAERVGEWTYRDVVLHIAAWMESVPGWLAEIRGGGDPWKGFDAKTVDEFNARAVAARRLVGPEAALDELDTAYRRLLAEARGLSDDEARDRRVHAIFAWCTYLHFEEHYAELGVEVR